MQSEALSEIVARFAALFGVPTEDTRFAPVPEAFDPARAAETAGRDLASSTVNVRTDHKIAEHEPGVQHSDRVDPVDPGRAPRVADPVIEITAPRTAPEPIGVERPDIPSFDKAPPSPTVPLQTAIGHEVALGVRQVNQLADDDVLVMGSGGVEHVETGSLAKIDAAIEAIKALSDEVLLHDGADGMPALDPQGVAAIKALALETGTLNDPNAGQDEADGAASGEGRGEGEDVGPIADAAREPATIEVHLKLDWDVNGVHLDGVAVTATPPVEDDGETEDGAESVIAAMQDTGGEDRAGDAAGDDGPPADEEDESDPFPSLEALRKARDDARGREGEAEEEDTDGDEPDLDPDGDGFLDNGATLAVGKWHTVRDAEVAHDERDGPVPKDAAGATIEPSIEATVGGNTLTNVATIDNSGIVAAKWAVNGDLHQLDLVVQSNAWSDHDAGLVGSAVPTIAGSLATMTAPGLDGNSTVGPSGRFTIDELPPAWHVTVAEGDFVAMEWVRQRNVVSDEDVLSIAHSAAHSSVTLGGNTALNALSFEHLGAAYDMVVVGGNAHDLNVIVQTNILIDDDLVEGIAPGKAGYDVTGDGNILWNEATIENVRAERTDGFDPALEKAVDDFASGRSAELPGEGAPLVVLYIKGNLFDVNIIEQTNILIDSDRLIEPDRDGGIEGTLTAALGDNELINIAAIRDVDGLEGMAVGGQHYSDALLVQGELAEGFFLEHGLFGGDETPALASEVVAFIGTDGEVADEGEAGVAAPTVQPGDFADVMGII